MNYIEISKEAIGNMYKAHAALRKSELDEKLIALVELRVSQMNGCAYCCSFHTNELRAFGMEQSLIDKLPGWKLSKAFDTRQRLVLEWAEAVTLVSGSISEVHYWLKDHFTTREIVDLTASIALMNALNRLRITLGEAE
ncbi:carboxymuconolactone decarboxylase family protein [Flavobacterium kingsejongi]|uniref:Carboxymuconolactone decarboxylase n=1 Tax=Flavobacterium kingsejongi TaxID=1678728 RepID=A0A2S1LPA2_9FLAO|nr:carboxymuconolactone decarboxylase family protein [Flavobacterium kingsejongi]AWG25583.1 carboxymuconolactone decarboxylase [Flavobacterium kingsejongi]